MKGLILVSVTAAILLTTAFFSVYNTQIEKPKKFLQPTLLCEIPTQIYDAWVHWKQANQNTFGNDTEDCYRAQVFHKNLQYIIANQSQDGSYTIGLNKFAAMTPEEFKKTYLNTKIPTQKKNEKSLLNKSQIDNGLSPSIKSQNGIDWQQRGAVTPIKNQGQCGSCWSFAVSGALEGLNQIRSESLQSFSEQQQMDCSKDLGNLSCQGGFMDKSYDYVQSKGIMSEENYPYTALDRDTCDYDSSKVEFNIDGHNDVPIDDNDELTAAIERGPVSVGISGDQIQFYVNGIWSYWLCFTEVDHGVLAVGYGVDESGKMFYKVKNSWGADWGEEGYIRFERREGKSAGMCGITKQASYPVKN